MRREKGESMKKTWAPLLCFLSALSVLLSPSQSGGEERAKRYVCLVKAIYPHDAADSVQGLIVAGNVLYESTGGYGTSSLTRKELTSGRSLRRHRLPDDLFGEGIAVHGGWLYQLTWKSGKVFKYDLEEFRPVAEHAIATEGWGLTTDGERLVVSDGSAVLRFYAPAGFREIGEVTVTEGGEPVAGLNELEYVQGLIYANLYPTTELVMIDPATGRVVGRADLGGLKAEVDSETGAAGVVNGIAYDPRTDRLLVTGKLWPSLFEIELVPENGL
jgi:glutaminyl-peptide cyclotransferase